MAAVEAAPDATVNAACPIPVAAKAVPALMAVAAPAATAVPAVVAAEDNAAPVVGAAAASAVPAVVKNSWIDKMMLAKIVVRVTMACLWTEWSPSFSSVGRYGSRLPIPNC